MEDRADCVDICSGSKFAPILKIYSSLVLCSMLILLDVKPVGVEITIDPPFSLLVYGCSILLLGEHEQ